MVGEESKDHYGEGSKASGAALEVRGVGKEPGDLIWKRDDDDDLIGVGDRFAEDVVVGGLYNLTKGPARAERKNGEGIAVDVHKRRLLKSWTWYNSTLWYRVQLHSRRRLCTSTAMIC